MISQEEANKIDQWLKEFHKEHGDIMVVNDDVIRDLARVLCDDIPLGYEASHRLANWLFCYLNIPKISRKLHKDIQPMVEAEKRLDKAFDDYKQCARDLMSTFEDFKEAE